MKTTMRKHFLPTWMAIIRKTITSTDKDVKKLKPLYIANGDEDGEVTLESSLADPQRLNIKLPYDPAIPLLVKYSREIKPCVNTETYTQMIIAALFIITKHGNHTNIYQLMNG